ncbi:MAG TPA: cobalamin biosynthesis protein CbiX, partial [Betaproteobacteria bacterium]|nr:cobalamin biosynthesis protein CbiX [Betaproteobacteria bacterium]
MNGLILFAHGARDPRWAVPFERLQALTQAQRPDWQVALA